MGQQIIIKKSSGIGVFGLLGVSFVVLKLTGYIDWSWWFVTMPFWFGFGILLVICIGASAVFLLESLIDFWLEIFKSKK